MAAAAEPLSTTVKQYRELPERNDAVQELHWGEIVTLTRPKMGDTKLRYRLVELLRPSAEQHGIVASEVPFRALPEYDLRGADVAFVSQTRWDATSDDDNLRRSPELVVEILSPSNTKSEIREKAALYLSTGTQEFWVVDPKRKSVSVARPSGESVVYGTGDRIPLTVFGGMIEVADIFNFNWHSRTSQSFVPARRRDVAQNMTPTVPAGTYERSLAECTKAEPQSSFVLRATAKARYSKHDK